MGRDMINRTNWNLVNEYLVYRDEVELMSKRTIRLDKTFLNHTLFWSGEHSFKEAPKIRPTYPVYIRRARLDGSNEAFSHEYARKLISAARRFFLWLSTHKQGYKAITPQWLATLRVRNSFNQSFEHEAVTMSEILAMAHAPAITVLEKRTQALAVFLWLSGARIEAASTLPICAVDIDGLQIRQWPELGTKTKYGKKATTYLFNMSELITILQDWDDMVRPLLPNNAPWIAHLSPGTGEIDPNRSEKSAHRGAGLRKDLQNWLAKVNLPYHSPHKFRHGHAVYGIKQAQDIGDLKALSQNLMHDSLQVTDKIYGILSILDVKERITQLGCQNDQLQARKLIRELYKITSENNLF
jgi:integrase